MMQNINERGADATAVPVNPVFYPDYSTIQRCAMMHDSGGRKNSKKRKARRGK